MGVLRAHTSAIGCIALTYGCYYASAIKGTYAIEVHTATVKFFPSENFPLYSSSNVYTAVHKVCLGTNGKILGSVGYRTQT